MRSLLHKLLPPGTLYPWDHLPPLGIDEEAIERAKQSLKLMPYNPQAGMS
jgi:hypothetical protein